MQKSKIESVPTNTIPKIINATTEMQNSMSAKSDEKEKSLKSRLSSFIAGSVIGGGTLAFGIGLAMEAFNPYFIRTQSFLLANTIYVASVASSAILSGVVATKFAGNELFNKSCKFGAAVGFCTWVFYPIMGAAVLSAYLSGALMAISLKVRESKETEGNDGQSHI
jgi:hypothetical protein